MSSSDAPGQPASTGRPLGVSITADAPALLGGALAGLARRLDERGVDYLHLDDLSLNGETRRETPDPLIVVSSIVAVTRRIGLISTHTAIQNEPFVQARYLAVLDHLSEGRAGWQYRQPGTERAWTSSTADPDPSAGRAGRDREFLDVVYALWEDSWDDDAVQRDRERGIYADPRKVRFINHLGPHYSVDGPFISEPSPQRSPVLFWRWTTIDHFAAIAPYVEVVVIDGEAQPDQAAEIRHHAESAVNDSGRTTPAQFHAAVRLPDEADPAAVGALLATAEEQRQRLGAVGLQLVAGDAWLGPAAGTAWEVLLDALPVNARRPRILRERLTGAARLGWADWSREQRRLRLGRDTAHPAPAVDDIERN